MDARPLSVNTVFDQTRHLVVPLFQRPYVWNEEEQWAPLWHDIQSLAERIVMKQPVHPHFLGAVVLDHSRNPTGEIETRTIIDGQQRLTTLQLFLEAFADLCVVNKEPRHSEALRRLTRNNDPLSEDTDAIFKVWPTNADRDHFRRVMEASSPTELRKTYKKSPDSGSVGHPIADAYLFFHASIADWVGGSSKASAGRVVALYQALKSHLQLVVIDLGKEDDAQMIFETLNARGTPLLASDLVKNFLFHEVTNDGHDLPKLYAKYWQTFDDQHKYWRANVGRGHAKRARIDLFLQHYQTLKQRDVVEVAHLYSTFRTFVRDSPGRARQQFVALHDYGSIFRSLDTLPPDSRAGQFMYRLSIMDVGTLYPFLLELFHLYKDEPDTIANTLSAIESWLVRRMVCQLNTRGYNRLFVELLGTLDGTPSGLPGRVRSFLLSSDSESARWPRDAEFKKAWSEAAIYQVLVRERVRMVLEALEQQLWSAKSERMTLHDKLTIEHVLPQSWGQHWPLPAKGGIEKATDHRNHVVHTFGNLTLLTKKLNPSVSNGPWSKKRPEIRKHSALKLNLDVVGVDDWSETTIAARGESLFAIACKIWPVHSKK